MSQLPARRPESARRTSFVVYLGAAESADASAADLAERWNVAVRVVRGERCRTKQSLMREWAAALQFPSYFGENWDAFEECMSDLSWLRREYCAVYITEFDMVLARSRSEFNTLLSVLHGAARASSDSAGPRAVKLIFFLQCPKAREQNLRARLAQAPIKSDQITWIRELHTDALLEALGVAG